MSVLSIKHVQAMANLSPTSKLLIKNPDVFHRAMEAKNQWMSNLRVSLRQCQNLFPGRTNETLSDCLKMMLWQDCMK